MIDEYKKRKIRAFEEIISKEMSGILLMNSKKRFNMCEKILSKNGNVKQFITDIISEMAKCLPKEKNIDNVNKFHWDKDSNDARHFAGGEIVGHNKCRDKFFNNLGKIK